MKASLAAVALAVLIFTPAIGLNIPAKLAPPLKKFEVCSSLLYEIPSVVAAYVIVLKPSIPFVE